MTDDGVAWTIVDAPAPAQGAAALDRAVWKTLRYHPEQHRFWVCTARYQVVCAGRRSGKTAIAKRKLIRAALIYAATHDGKFVFAAPTRDQAKRIYWEDAKRMVPRAFIDKISETDLTLTLITGTRICIVGLDKPQRIEGEPLDGIVIDEVDEVKPSAWHSSIRPALSTPGRPPGWVIFIGRPKGRRLLYELFSKARTGEDPEWAGFRWKSSDIVDPHEIEQARRDLDARMYAQEYDADFISFEGRIYHSFNAALHAAERLPYFPDQPLMLCFDFNVKPGVAEVVQEQRYWGRNPKVAGEITASIGEVWIPDDSNTLKVCRKLIEDWGKHRGEVLVYGDATGGARGTAAVDGSDWVLIERELRRVFGARLSMRVGMSNPPERVRVNCVNSRLLNADGIARWLFDPERCPRLVDDMDSVVAQVGSAGEIEKKKYPMLTHCSDSVGYMAEKRYPITDHTMSSEEL